MSVFNIHGNCHSTFAHLLCSQNRLLKISRAAQWVALSSIVLRAYWNLDQVQSCTTKATWLAGKERLRDWALRCERGGMWLPKKMGTLERKRKCISKWQKSLNLSCVAFLGNKGGVLGKLLLFRQETLASVWLGQSVCFFLLSTVLLFNC